MNSLPKLTKELRSTTVRAILLKELRDGIFKDSAKLPPSDVLGDQLGVSRTVVRDALSDLEREGFVVRTRGIGTVINRRVLDIKTRMDLETEFMSLVADAGYTPKLDHSEMYIQDAGETTAGRLQLDAGEPVVICERSVLADGRPIIYAVDSVPKKIFKIEKLEAVDWSLPIFEIIGRYCGTSIEMDLTNIHAVLGEGKVKKILRLEENVPLVYFDEVGYDAQNNPILWSQEYYVDNVFDLVLLRKKIAGDYF